MQLFYLARIMGTSVAENDKIRAPLARLGGAYLRGLLDDYDDVVD